ncbi:GRIP domain-containing protein [Strongyloides ratti]|uniref:GRIP domain-containing protein n=1 Tax=Strongyloides ratti TaxID=34506 RepID=A0A090N0U0_STRRB|nr:GRIP domain-containing protein [Strongyloides ratti]CEF71273.1 GRIP domain-containing protein [Strongyloides ratti]
MGDKKQNIKITNNPSSDVELYKQKIQTLLQAYKEQEDEKRRLQEVVETMKMVTVDDESVNKLRSMLAEGEKQRLKKEKILLADRKGLLEKYNESRKELKLIKDKIKQAGLNIDDSSDITLNFDKVNNLYEKFKNKKENNDNDLIENNKLNNTIHIQNLLIDTKKTFETDSKSLNKKIENLYKINIEKDIRIANLESANEISTLKVAELANENTSYLEKISSLEKEIEQLKNMTSHSRKNSLVSEEEDKSFDLCKQKQNFEIIENNLNYNISNIFENDNKCRTSICHKCSINVCKELIKKDDLDSILKEITNISFDMMNIKSYMLENLQSFKKEINHLLFMLIDDANSFVKDVYKKQSLEIEKFKKIIKEQREEIDLLKKYSEICKIKGQIQGNSNNFERKRSLSRNSSTTTDLYSLINDKNNHHHNENVKSNLTNTEETVLVHHYVEQLTKKEKILENIQKEFVLLEGKYNDCLKEKLGAQMEYESQIQLLQDQIRDIRGSTKQLQVNDFQYIRNVFISYLNTRSNDFISRRNMLKALGQVLSLSNLDLHRIDTFK